MRTRWLVLSLCLLCLAGAWFLLHLKNGRDGSPSRPHEAVAPAVQPHPASTAPQLLAAASTNGAALAKTNPFPWRLSNTTKPLGQLVKDSHAILLENALIDTANPLNLSIPTHLQSQGDPGAYIVQARGPIDNAFRAMLAAAGAEIVSYIPNDAYLVRAPAGVANGLTDNPLTQAVTPYEPYYKIQSSLLDLAVNQLPLPAGTMLTMGLFTATAPQTIQEIEKLGGTILTQEKTPVGTIVKVIPPRDWTALAALSGTKNVEPSHSRVPANDLSRATVGVAANTRTTTNYLNLYGSNVLVQVNDSGIDASHPDFQTGSGLPVRVSGSLTDTDGHGTHVAGIIAGNGLMWSTVTNARGSIIPATNYQFRGKAPLAKLLSMDWYDSDQDLQAAAAQTNALISNNSWNYGNDNAYDLAAASYDAAVRDALPGTTGSQPVLFVFSAGNDGGGNDSGGGGDPDTIWSPATAKNVITVGAIEQLRNITNTVVDRSSNSTAVWKPQTDSSSQVAGNSSRGNVGVGTEGTYGRYKPDVVAPGSFVLSTRSAQWDQVAYYNPTNYSFNLITNQVVAPNTLNRHSLSVPANAVGVIIFIQANRFSPTPFPTNLPIYVQRADFPTTTNYDFVIWNNEVSIPPNSGGSISGIASIQNRGFFYAVGNTNNFSLSYDLITEVITTNDLGNYFQVLSNLNQSIGTNNPLSSPNPSGPGPYYRYESGTSMAAADVSGVLALMQDYFTNKLSLQPSPALLKAMLINGARPDGNYDFQVTNSINYQGWGLINLPNTLPPGITTNVLNANGESMLILDQTGTGLATGDSPTFEIDIPDGSDQQYLPLKITLAWTDPPGDPAAAIKLVNNLDLVVSNADTGEVFFGNDISQGQIYNTPEAGTNTSSFDAINNVENVFIQPLLGTKYFVTVIGRSVNVNAVTAHPNNVVQDYALVISCGEGEVTNAFTVNTNTGWFVSNPTTDQQVTYVVTTNAPLLNQFVGASTPLLGTENIQLTAGGTELNGIQLAPTNVVLTLGMTNQWHFYVITNPPSNAADFTNAAFITFVPDTLSIPRIGVYQDSLGNATRPEADIDIFVSTNSALTNLDLMVISNANKSVGRGGVEFVYYTNSAPGDVYYVGVYSEDQEASEYGFIPIFTDIPFSQPGPNGSQIVNGLNVPVNIPDGNSLHPGIGYVFALAINPMQVKRVVVNDTIFHQNFGDLIGTLTHSQQTGLGRGDVLNNHDSLFNASGIYTNIYDDSNQGDIAGARTSDGPGTLNGYLGQQAIGPWILAEVDDSLTHTGSVTGFSLLIEPHNGKNGATTFENTPPCTMSHTDFIDVPPGATNLTILVTNLTPSPQPIVLYVKFGTWPTTNNFDEMADVIPPATNGMISIGPPLTPGRYFYGVFAPCSDTASQSNSVTATYYVGAAPGQVIFNSSGPAPILDDAVITNSIFVTAAQTLASDNPLDVALRVDHPRVSDLVFHLTSPDGTRMLLVENRGGTTTEGMGQTLAITNIVPVTASGFTLPTTNVVNTVSSNGTLAVQYNFYTQPDEMVVFDQGGILIFDSGIISGSGIFNIAYTNSSVLTIVMNPNGNSPGNRWDYTVNALQAYNTYLVLTEDTNKTTTPIKFAPTPFHGTATLTTSNNMVVGTNVVVTTNYPTTTNYSPVYNAPFGWHSSFEGSPAGYYYAPAIFAEGWQVTAGNVTVITFGAYEGNSYININALLGSGTISTNVVGTVAGQTYQLSFAYSKDAAPGKPGVQLSANGSPLLTLSVTNLGWATTSLLFTATSPTTTFQFASQTGGAHGALLDAIYLTPLGGANGFEGATAGDYAQGHYFDGWFVSSNQVTVIADSTLANEGNQLLALADGTISRILPTMPGQIYTLTYSYRGPGIVSLWRGENNALDSINGNNGIPTGITYTTGKVGTAFVFDGSTSFIRVPASSSLNVGLGNGFTLETWINPTGPKYLQTIFEWNQGSGADPIGAHVEIGGAGTMNLYANLIDTSLNDHHIYSVDNIMTYTNFQHEVLTYNKSTGLAVFYLNGVVVTNVNQGIFTPQTSFDFFMGLRVAGVFSGGVSYLWAALDEPSVYNRALSASEIQAIYQKGGAGKFDPAAPTIAQGLAEAQITAGSTSFTFFGSNTNWLTNTITFTATQTNMPVQITGIEPGMLLDHFVLTNGVVVTNITYTTNYFPYTNNVVTTNASGGDVFYLPEQSLDMFAGVNAYGQWQLEVWDNRAGAGLTNTLVNWQLRFNFASSLSSVGVLTNGLAVTNVIPAGSIAYYLVIVPTNADFATNRLLFATGPLNVWFNPAVLPVATNPPDYVLITNSTGGHSILSLTSMPTNIVPGGTYYLGVQNTGTSNITYGIEVDFHLVFPPVPPPSIGTQVVNELTLLTVTNTGASGHQPLTYSVTISVDTNAMLLNGWPLFYVGTVPAPVISANGIITWTPSEAQGPGVYTFTTIITDSSLPPLSATNSFSVIVNEVNTSPYFLNIPTNQTIGALSTLIVNNAAGDVDLPPNPLTYLLINPPAGMTIDTTGFITWTPTLGQVSAIPYVITTVVSDFSLYALSNNVLSITNQFTVRVTAVAPPYAFSQPATSVTGTNAQLNGMATPNGPPTTVWFDWGTSASYGNQTPAVNVGGSYHVVDVTSQINNLVMHQPYHFRLVASNAVGVVYGFDQIFDETGVVAWGGDYANQTDVPPGLSNMVAVAGAYDHSLALKNNGLVTAWGDNTKNQTNVPAGLNGVVAVAGGEYYSLALKNDGTVVAWGGNILGQTNVPAGLNGVVNIAGGTFASLALKSNGQVVSWGANFSNLTNVTPGLSDIVAVAGGGYHSLAVKNDGTVLVWGDNSAHQTNMPPGLSNVVAIAGGSYHSLVLKHDGTVVAWGDNTAGQTNVPAGLSNVVAIAAGGYHSLVLKNDGSVLAWGDNTDNQTNIPASLSNVVAISSGYFHNLALASPFKVNFTNTPPFFLTNSLPPQVMNELTTLTVPDPASDSDLPPQTLTYTVTAVVDTNAMIVNGWPLGYATGNPPPTVNSSGVISWTPDEAQGPGVYFINTVVTDNGAPPLSATNSFIVTVNEVNTPPFWPANVPSQTNYIINMLTPLVVTDTAMDSDLPPNPLTYRFLSSPPGATMDTNGIISWTPTLAQGGTTNVFTTVVTDTNPPAVNAKSFSVTNSFTVVVTTLINLPGGQPQTNSAAAHSTNYYVVTVPANADFATNILLYATGPLNIWFTTNSPPSITNATDVRLLPDVAYPTGTNGSVVLSAATAPPLVPGSTYYLGVQNTNAGTVAYEIEVDFHLMFGSITGAITGLTVTATNNNGTNGFLVQWQGPTNFQYEIQWTTSLLSPMAWHTVLDPVINVFVTATNGHFSWFDDGTLTGGPAFMKFYRILGGPDLGPITGSGPVTGTVLAGAMSQAVVTVPANAPWASNVLLYATGPLNVWFNQTNPPTGNTNAGDSLMLSAASAGVFVLTSNSVPPLVSGANYYLGFQNPGAGNVTFGFQVAFGLAPTNAVSNFSITLTTNGLFQLQWTAPTNYQFQAEWTTNLMAPEVWTTNAVFITSTNGTFTFVDTNAPTVMKFYRLIEYP